MNARQLLADCRAQGIDVEVRGQNLKLHADHEPPAELVERVRALKPEIVRELATVVRFPDGTPLTDSDIEHWLDAIEETDPQARREWMKRCRTDTATRECTARLIDEQRRLSPPSIQQNQRIGAADVDNPPSVPPKEANK